MNSTNSACHEIAIHLRFTTASADLSEGIRPACLTYP